MDHAKERLMGGEETELLAAKCLGFKRTRHTEAWRIGGNEAQLTSIRESKCVW